MNEALLQHLAARSQMTLSPAMEHLCGELQRRFGGSTAAMLYYGSCLRSGAEQEGLVDFYVLVDSYRVAHGAGLSAVANKLLPPNVYYLETPYQGKVLRAKVAVVSLADFRHGCERWFHSYLWGRFAQPAALVYCRDAAAHGAVMESLAWAVQRFLAETVPVLPQEIGTLEAWQWGLSLSYRCELRPERPGRVQALVLAFADEYRQVTPLALTEQPLVKLRDGMLEVFASPSQRRWGHWRWRVRRGQGLLLSLARLVKASFTFAGGIDYLAWKLERHTGERVQVSERLRRWPLVFVWGELWRLYRRRVLR